MNSYCRPAFGHAVADVTFDGIQIAHTIDDLETKFGIISTANVEINGINDTYEIGAIKIETTDYVFGSMRYRVWHKIPPTGANWFDVEIRRAVTDYIAGIKDRIIDELMVEVRG